MQIALDKILFIVATCLSAVSSKQKNKKVLKGDETKIILNDKSSLKTDVKAAKAYAVQHFTVVIDISEL